MPTKESLDYRDEFLSQNGKRVHQVKEVKPGDTLCMVDAHLDVKHYNNINLWNVKTTHLEPSFLKFDYFPYARLHAPNFCFNVSKEEFKPVGYTSLGFNEGDPVQTWHPFVLSDNLSEERLKIQRESIEDDLSQNYKKRFGDERRVYVMNEGKYTQLGSLIPEVEFPNLHFLPQSLNLDTLVSMIEGAKPEIERLRSVAEDLKRAFKHP